MKPYLSAHYYQKVKSRNVLLTGRNPPNYFYQCNLQNSFIHFQVETTEIAKQQRANIMEQKLQAIKQQGIPKKRSLLKTPSKTSLHAGTCSSVTQKRQRCNRISCKESVMFCSIGSYQKNKSLELSTYFNKTLKIHFYEEIVNKCQTFNK